MHAQLVLSVLQGLDIATAARCILDSWTSVDQNFYREPIFSNRRFCIRLFRDQIRFAAVCLSIARTISEGQTSKDQKGHQTKRRDKLFPHLFVLLTKIVVC